MSFDEMQPIFGKVVAEWSSPPPPTASSAAFLFYVNSSDRSAIQVIATDFHSNTFKAIKSREQLDDLRDDIGIGGSWSEFVDYVTTSLKSGDVKLVIDGVSGSGGASCAKLIAQKSKGMPRIVFSLAKLIGDAASEAKANLSLDLYKEFKDVQNSLTHEQESKSQLTKVVAAEQVTQLGPSSIAKLRKICFQEKNVTLQKQLDMMLYPRKNKSQKINDKIDSDSTSVMVSQDSPEKQAAQNANSRKGTNRVVPAFRRSKVRGAVLGDTEDDA